MDLSSARLKWIRVKSGSSPARLKWGRLKSGSSLSDNVSLIIPSHSSATFSVSLCEWGAIECLAECSATSAVPSPEEEEATERAVFGVA